MCARGSRGELPTQGTWRCDSSPAQSRWASALSPPAWGSWLDSPPLGGLSTPAVGLQICPTVGWAQPGPSTMPRSSRPQGLRRVTCLWAQGQLGAAACELGSAGPCRPAARAQGGRQRGRRQPLCAPAPGSLLPTSLPSVEGAGRGGLEPWREACRRMEWA